MRWHCPLEAWFEIRSVMRSGRVSGRALYLSVTEAPHNTESLRVNREVTYVSLKTECQSGGRTRDHLTFQVGTQQTQNICITFVQRRPNIFDVGPTLCNCYTNVLCLLGSCKNCTRGPAQSARCFLEPIACSCWCTFESSDAVQFCLALWKAVKSRGWSAASKKISLCITVVIFTLEK